MKLETERIQYWIGKGAIPSNTAARLLKKNGMKDMDKYMDTYTKKKSKNEAPPEVVAPTPAVQAAPAEAAKEEAAPAEAPAAPVADAPAETPQAEGSDTAPKA